MENLLKYSLISIVFSLSPILSQATRSTEVDSTQPRGSAIENAQEFSLAPIIDGFRAPARTVGLKFRSDDNRYFDWAGTMMWNSTRDPFFLSELMAMNALIYTVINNISGDPQGPQQVISTGLWKVRALRVSAHEQLFLSEMRGSALKKNYLLTPC